MGRKTLKYNLPEMENVMKMETTYGLIQSCDLYRWTAVRHRHQTQAVAKRVTTVCLHSTGPPPGCPVIRHIEGEVCTPPVCTRLPGWRHRLPSTGLTSGSGTSLCLKKHLLNVYIVALITQILNLILIVNSVTNCTECYLV